MKKVKKSLLASGILLAGAAMVLAGCSKDSSSEGGKSSDESSESVTPKVPETPTTMVTLGEDFVKEAADSTYFAPHLVYEDGAYASAKNDALIISGDSVYLFAYGLPEGYSTGVTVLDSTGNVSNKIQVAADGKLTMPTVTAREDYKVYLYGMKDGAKTIKKEMNVAVVPASMVNSSADGWVDNTGLNATERELAAGALEHYMLAQGIAPIGIRDSGGYVLYSDRINTPFLDQGKYIPGYGYGILTYGTISKALDAEKTEAYKMYFHDQEAVENDTGNFNVMNSQSGAAEDFYGYTAISAWNKYVTESLGGSRYEGVASREDAPIAVSPDKYGASDTWKIKLRVGGETADESKGVTPGFNYRTASKIPALAAFDNRPVALDDYLTGFKLLSNGALNWFRGNEQATETTKNRQYEGFAAHFTATKDATALDTSAELQDAIGVTLDETDNSITIKMNGKITPDYAEYQLDGYWANPIPVEFLEALGDGDAFEGAKIYGATSQDTTKTPLDTLLSVGPYYYSAYEFQKTSAFAKNESWPLCKDNAGRDLYQIKGVHLNMNSAITTNATEYIEKFEAGITDYSNIPESEWDKWVSSPCKHPVDGSNITAYSFKLNMMDAAYYEQRFPQGEWEVEPACSNDNFYRGLACGIDRIAYANATHSNPRYEMAEPITMVSPKADHVYLSSDPHKAAVELVFGDKLADYANWKENGAEYFEAAIAEELDAGHYTLGTGAEPAQITLDFIELKTTDVHKGLDKLVTDSWAEAFALAVKSHTNDAGEFEWCEKAQDGTLLPKIELVSTIDYLDYADDTDAQNKMIFGNHGVQKGWSDGQLSFYISGNAYDVVNCFDKYEQYNKFVLNFACDTDMISPDIYYGGKYWSFADLWDVFNTGGSFFKDGYQVDTFTFDGPSSIVGAGDGVETAKTVSVTVDIDYVEQATILGWVIDLVSEKGAIDESYYNITPTVNEDGSLTFTAPVDYLVDYGDVYDYYAEYVNPAYAQYAEAYRGVKWFEVVAVLSVDIGEEDPIQQTASFGIDIIEVEGVWYVAE